MEATQMKFKPNLNGNGRHGRKVRNGNKGMRTQITKDKNIKTNGICGRMV